MSRRTYTIDTTLRREGKTYEVNYCPWGRGRRCWDSVTSYDQYKDELHEHLTSSDVTLYTIDGRGHSVCINDDDSLSKAARAVQPGGELAIIALKDDGEEPNWPEPYGPYKNHWKDVMKRFEVPGDVDCFRGKKYGYSCVMTGNRYVWERDHRFAICYSCWKRTSKKEIWKKCNEAGAPWDGEVPDAPLSGEYCPPGRDDVRHLNYVLCRLGYIDLDVFRHHSTRKYGHHTEEAVRLFRKTYRIRGYDMEEYNEATEKKMEELVHRFRRHGALFI